MLKRLANYIALRLSNYNSVKFYDMGGYGSN